MKDKVYLGILIVIVVILVAAWFVGDPEDQGWILGTGALVVFFFVPLKLWDEGFFKRFKKKREPLPEDFAKHRTF